MLQESSEESTLRITELRENILKTHTSVSRAKHLLANKRKAYRTAVLALARTLADRGETFGAYDIDPTQRATFAGRVLMDHYSEVYEPNEPYILDFTFGHSGRVGQRTYFRKTR